jgi:hypothetical protein
MGAIGAGALGTSTFLHLDCGLGLELAEASWSGFAFALPLCLVIAFEIVKAFVILFAVLFVMIAFFG